MRYKIITVLIVLILCATFSIAEPQWFVVKKVIDGDTIELWNGERVRYIGVDTPETNKIKNGIWIFDPEPYSVEAKAFNKDLVEGKEVSLEFDTEKLDKYGRLLAYVKTHDGLMVNEELLRSGLARTLFIFPNLRYLEEFKSIQEEARRSDRGLWKNN
ncbi:MAG: thermonuclease family protein [Candidatus Omnitrophota bacterium]